MGPSTYTNVYVCSLLFVCIVLQNHNALAGTQAEASILLKTEFYIIVLVTSKLRLVVICDRTTSGTTWVPLEYYILDCYVDRDQNKLYSKVSAKTNT